MYVLRSSVANQGVTTSDNYTDANTLQCPDAVKLNIEVKNNPVVIQFALRYPGTPRGGIAFGPELPIGRAYRSLLRNCDAVRVRSATAGASGLVTIEALTKMEADV